jgi:hypothetical protein
MNSRTSLKISPGLVFSTLTNPSLSLLHSKISSSLIERRDWSLTLMIKRKSLRFKTSSQMTSISTCLQTRRNRGLVTSCSKLILIIQQSQLSILSNGQTSLILVIVTCTSSRRLISKVKNRDPLSLVTRVSASTHSTCSSLTCKPSLLSFGMRVINSGSHQ